MSFLATSGPTGATGARHSSLVVDDLRILQHNTEDRASPVDRDSPMDFLLDALTGLAAFVCMFGAATILSILYVTVRPFSKPFYRRLAAHLGAASFLDALTLLLPNTRLYLTGDSDVPSPVGTSVLVCNHMMDADWWSIFMLGRCVGLRGTIKVFLRKELLRVDQVKQERQSSFDERRSPGTSTQVTHTTKSVSFVRNGSMGTGSKLHTSPQMALAGKLLYLLLDFPVLVSAENNREYVSDRHEMFHLLRSFAENNGADAPVHLLLYPEGWSLHEGSSSDRKALLAKSNEFAMREGRPQLKHLLLPRTTGFNASLECLRESSPVVYDVTMAYHGYDGTLQDPVDLSLPALWKILRKRFPSEVHLRIKRYSMEEVLQDASWLDKQWAEKDRLLSHFARHQSFPTDSRGFCRHRVFDTRRQSMESSVLALIRLLLLPCFVPLLLLLSLPIIWVVLWVWLAFKSYQVLFPDPQSSGTCSSDELAGTNTSHTPGSAGPDSATGTPFVPATPFVSPSTTKWRHMIANGESKSGRR